MAMSNAQKAERAARAAQAPGASKLPTGKVETPAAKAERSGEKVTVACRVPNGLRLRLFRFEEASELVLGGGTRTYQRSIPITKGDKPLEVVVHGPSIPMGFAPSYLIVGGYALTPNIDKDFFEAWMEQNRNTDLVRNKMIFCQEHTQDAQAQAQEQKDVRSGMEPMDMSMTTRNGRQVVKDQRMPRPTSSALDPLRTIEDRPAGGA